MNMILISVNRLIYIGIMDRDLISVFYMNETIYRIQICDHVNEMAEKH